MEDKQNTVSDCSVFRTQATFNLGKDKRYSLKKEWFKDCDKEKKATVIMYNPSIASELKTDLSVSKCINILIDHGYNSMEVVNIFAKREKKPSLLKKADKIFDPINLRFVKESFDNAEIIIIAWGYDGGKKVRDKEILNLIQNNKDKLRAFFNPLEGRMIPLEVIIPIHPRNISEDNAKILGFNLDLYLKNEKNQLKKEC